MPKRSAGLLLYRWQSGGIEVLLVHPGGPFWARRDLGAWSIPKGEHDHAEDARDAACREFREETGMVVPADGLVPLGEAVQPSRKVVAAFAVERNLDPAAIRSNMVEIVWPPRSGRRLLIPEIDRAAWFAPDEARRRILPGQAIFIERLLALLSPSPG